MFVNRTFIKDIYQNEEKYKNKEITICGMINNIRKQTNLCFIDVNDGSQLKGLQVILEKQEDKEYTQDYLTLFEKGSKGMIISVNGLLIESPAKGQSVELKANIVNYFNSIIDGNEYPISKNRVPMENLRQILHLRMRTNVISSVMRIRSKCSKYTHDYFQDRGYEYIHTPLITGSDCEGAGETFTLTTLLPDKLDKDNMTLKEDYSKDFFGKKVSLTVSGQLNVESYAMYFSKVYTFGPTFRAENSNTSRHLAEFWMIEPEITYINLEELMDVAEDYLKYCVINVLDNYLDELTMFNQFMSKGLIERLTNIKNNKFIRISYTQAIELYNKDHKKTPIKWGDDLSSEVEKYICEKIYGLPTIIYHYPKEIKAFYMKQNKEDNRVVDAFDILVPGIGEIIGGSMREDNYDILKQKVIDTGIDVNSMSWYLDLRKYGTCPHGGFGLGFERLIMLVTGISNIRDVIPFPRYPKHCDC